MQINLIKKFQMKGSQRLQLHSRAQSQGNIKQAYNQIAQERELNSRNRQLRNKLRDDFHQPVESTQSITPQQSFSSGFFNNSQSYFSNNSSPQIKKIGLNFKVNRSNEIEEIIQQKLTMLRNTNAKSFYESNQSKDANGGLILNSTFVATPLNNQLKTTDYFAKNIVSNQIVFKQFSSFKNKSALREMSEKSLLQQKLLNESNEKINQQQQAQNIEKFVKDLFKPDSQQFQQAQDTKNKIKLEPRDDKSNTFKFYNYEQAYRTNTPKKKDFFVTKVSNQQFSSNNYSTILKDKYQKFEQDHRQLRNKFSQLQISPNSTALQKSSELNVSKYNESVDTNQAKDNNCRKNSSDLEMIQLVIPSFNKINDAARAKIHTAFKKTGEIDKNNYLNFKNSSPKNQKINELQKQNELQQTQSGLSQYKSQKSQSLEIERLPSQVQKQRIKVVDKQKLSFFVLLIFIDNLSNVKRKNNLKYKIYQIPYIYSQIPQKQIEDDFEDMKCTLKKLLGLNMKYLYFFKQNGTPLSTHLNFQYVDYNNEAIFFGSQGVFQGIQNIFCSQETQKNLQNSIQSLLDKVKLLNKNYVFQNQVNNINQDQIEENSNFGNQNDLSKYKILTREQLSQMRNRRHVDKIASTLMHNPNAIIKEYHPNRKQELKFQNIENNYQNQINQIKKIITEQPNEFEIPADKLQIKNLREIAKYVDTFLEDVENNKISKEQKKLQKEKDLLAQEYHGLDDLWSSQKESKKTNYIQQNIEKFHNKSTLMRELLNQNRELFIQNIPKLLNKYELSRHDLHSIYILYKALLSVSIQRIGYKEVFEKGIDFKTFELGVDRLSSQAEEIIQRMCSYKSFINWQSFLQILSSIQGKDLESKINIFIRVCDADKSGNLSRIEIEELCRICLQKFLVAGQDNILDQLVEYFTRLLFTSLNVDLEKEIPLDKIKQAIIQGHPESDLLCFFCGIN
ncbi:hypothetical protein TTHERM_00161290 (macronuclear) [Tetrahymena thermophila SB210]|uniref:EF-hand domain-containing protein n=1 Tax=Tetrahymena thermophila (strain SB210) TaxID=312017 RepID=Q22W03_TETTS|nr:hypothetical protein TTHERM_00161290 [Tetrahymena thermophila SB210]EAR89613.2 hypothetical protein TTHERM_00161290 [Tetrahymena thermophila SB210]|eukprot:XP_001009859.2 hypothetical protein TTHERM_00161290 [Tetrahymena thermophila SB210]